MPPAGGWIIIGGLRIRVFTTRAAAGEFVRGDPFVLNGIVRNWYIRDWHEALVPEPPAG
jgi:uncharacterized protein YciI